MTNLEAAMHIIQEYGKYETEFGFNLDKLEATAHAIFALAKGEENQDDCVCGD